MLINDGFIIIAQTRTAILFAHWNFLLFSSSKKNKKNETGKCDGCTTASAANETPSSPVRILFENGDFFPPVPFQRNTRPKVAYSNRFRPSTFIRCLHETTHVMENTPQHPL